MFTFSLGGVLCLLYFILFLVYFILFYLLLYEMLFGCFSFIELYGRQQTIYFVFNQFTFLFLLQEDLADDDVMILDTGHEVGIKRYCAVT